MGNERKRRFVSVSHFLYYFLCLAIDFVIAILVYERVIVSLLSVAERRGSAENEEVERC